MSVTSRLDPRVIEFVKALARDAVARDIAAARAQSPKRQDPSHAHSHLRPLLVDAPERPLD